MDGTLFPAELVEGFKIDKVIKYATTFPGGLYNTSVVFGGLEDSWGKAAAEAKGLKDAKKVLAVHPDGQLRGQGGPGA